MPQILTSIAISATDHYEPDGFVLEVKHVSGSWEDSGFAKGYPPSSTLVDQAERLTQFAQASGAPGVRYVTNNPDAAAWFRSIFSGIIPPPQVEVR
jgi:hypothetical protein